VTQADAAFAELPRWSFERVVGAALLPPGVAGTDEARWLYVDAPFVLLAHDTSVDPLFVYANRAAQACFEYGWDEFVGMPSRPSTEAPNRSERQRFTEGVLPRGYVDHYRGPRIANSGRRFRIDDTTVWNLVDADGALHGQATLVHRRTDA